MTTIYQLGEAPPVEAPRDPPPVGHGEFPFSYVWICPLCGEAWAKRVVTIRGQLFPEPFIPLSMVCEGHPARRPADVHGSLWLGWEPESNYNLPEPLLRREVQLHLNYYDRRMAEA